MTIPVILPAQNDLLQGKTVGIYFSKKNFTFNDYQHLQLAEFIASVKGREHVITDLKLEFLVLLGEMISAQIREVTGADSVFFLNSRPDLAHDWMGSYDPDRNVVVDPAGKFPPDYRVLVFNPFILGSYKTSSVYVRSNRVITRKIDISTARLQMTLFNPSAASKKAEQEVIYDEKEPVKNYLFDLNNDKSKTGKFLAGVFTKVFTLIQ